MLTASVAIVSLAAAAAMAAAFPAVQRPVADIVSPTWGDAATRDAADEVGQIATRLAIRPGMTVADIGAGNGYDTLRLSNVVGPAGAVVAEDVTAAYLATLRASVTTRGPRNVRIVVGDPGDPKLPPRSIDRAIMVHMYHEIARPYALLYHLAGAFRPGGRLGIEELDRPTQNHGTPPKLLTCELNAAGYRTVSLAPLKGGIGYFAVLAAPPAPVAVTARAASACRA
jgi:protein-L-isoaspartate O-methyltransferase